MTVFAALINRSSTFRGLLPIEQQWLLFADHFGRSQIARRVKMGWWMDEKNTGDSGRNPQHLRQHDTICVKRGCSGFSRVIKL